MTNDIYKFDKELFDVLKDVGYQSVSLRGNDDEIIITYNTPKTTVTKKLEEIKRRLVVLPPGYYKLMAMQKHGARGKADTFIIKHGNVTEQHQAAPVKALEETPHVLSYQEALKRIEELAAIKAERDALLKENEILKAEILELENELEATPLEENNINKTLENLTTAALPILDQYFTTKNRQLQLEENKLMIQYNKFNQRNKQQREPVRREANRSEINYPDVNNQEALAAFLDELDTLTDEQLTAALAIIQSENVPLFDICISEFYGQEEEEQEEEEQEEEEEEQEEK